MARTAQTVFVAAAMVRFLGVILTATTDLNPDQGSDTSGFASSAHSYATGEQSILFFLESLGTTYPTWGFILSPFWHLPGPSELYAQFAIALVGAYAVYNVYILVAYHISRQAALFATVPLILFPSFVALHSVILRDAAILAGLVYAIRIWTVPSRLSDTLRYLVAGGAIAFISLLRLENLPIYVAMFLAGYIAWRLPRQYHLPALATTALAGLAAYPTLERIFQWLGILRDRSLIDFLVHMRNARIREAGRTQYLTDVPVESLPDMLQYASVGAFYFLFVPFPWMAETVVDYVTVVESVVMLGFAVFAIRGIATLGKRKLPLAVALVVGLLLFAFFYGLISTNVGTSVRQRQTFSWLVIAFGGIGLAQYLHLEIRWRRDRTTADDDHIPERHSLSSSNSS